MLQKLRCWIGWHTYRVWGHVNVTDEIEHNYDYEYFYVCVHCKDGFWDYVYPMEKTGWYIPEGEYDSSDYISLDEVSHTPIL